MSGLQFITELTATLFSPKFEIERLCVGNNEVSFSPDVGKALASLKSLKFFRAGDKDRSLSLSVEEDLSSDLMDQ
jgi:hypothetical protein